METKQTPRTLNDATQTVIAQAADRIITMQRQGFGKARSEELARQSSTLGPKSWARVMAIVTAANIQVQG